MHSSFETEIARASSVQGCYCISLEKIFKIFTASMSSLEQLGAQFGNHRTKDDFNNNNKIILGL